MELLTDLFRGIMGISVLLGCCYLLSNSRKDIHWGLVAKGLGLQIILAIFILKGADMAEIWSPLGWPKIFFSWISSFFVVVLDFTTAGA